MFGCPPFMYFITKTGARSTFAGTAEPILMAPQPTKPLYKKAETHKAKVIRLSGQKNQYGRECFYSPTLRGTQGAEITVQLSVVPVTNTKTGELVNRIVIARTDSEKKESEQLDAVAQRVKRAGKSFGLSAQDSGKAGFERYLDTVFAPKADAQPSADEEKTATP